MFYVAIFLCGTLVGYVGGLLHMAHSASKAYRGGF